MKTLPSKYTNPIYISSHIYITIYISRFSFNMKKGPDPTVKKIYTIGHQRQLSFNFLQFKTKSH